MPHHYRIVCRNFNKPRHLQQLFLFSTHPLSVPPPPRATEKTKADMTPEELEKVEQQEFETGPMSVLTSSVKEGTQVLVFCRNNKKLLAKVKAFDRHCNMVLEDVKEMWTETPKAGKGQKKKKAISKDRYISKMFLRGDTVILVLRNPGGVQES